VWWLLVALGAIGLTASLSAFLARRHASRQTEALRESEVRLRGIFDSVSEAILIHEMHTGRILQVNKRMCKMFGCTEAEALSHSIDQFASGIPPYSADDAARWLNKVITDGPQLFNWQAKRLDNGILFPVEVSLRSTRLSNEDCILAVVRKTSIHDLPA
jgi:PAS domain S-box-containing protein